MRPSDIARWIAGQSWLEPAETWLQNVIVSLYRSGGLDKLEIPHFIQAACDGSQVQRPKPDPEPYLQVARKIGVQPGGCLVIEDSEAGVEAGVSAGMCVLGLGDREQLSNAFEIVNDLADVKIKNLRAIYKRWLGDRMI
jgi:beta-phosphoglucomutase-like phosphatase (HAD superfamily)